MAQSDLHSARSESPSRRAFLKNAAAGLPLLASLVVPPQVFGQLSGAPRGLEGVRALMFDVFGTVVDWRSSIIREGQLLAAQKGFDVDWPAFADRWRAGYGPSMGKVRRGELPWTKLDDLHRMILDELVAEFGLSSLSEAELDHFNQAWHRLSPWPDTVAGLNRLKTRYVIATMSNGNVSLLLNMAKNSGMPWDTILSAELSGHYKPDPESYLTAAQLLSLAPENVMMVAAHPADLRAAAALGFKTGYVYRPLEQGPDRIVARNTSDDFDVRAEDFIDLAIKLGA